MPTPADVLGRLAGGLVVSCQAPGDDPLSGPGAMTMMAASVLAGGAVGIRAEGLADVAAIRAAVDVPLIGLVKVPRSGPYITPSLELALAVAAAGADIVAIDGTGRARADGRSLAETVAALRERTACVVLADVASHADGLAAAAAGAHAISTTLAGYTDDTVAGPGADIDLVRGLAGAVDVPVIAEGRIRTPAEAVEAMRAGAWCVVVGNAITRPAAIARGFAEAIAADLAADGGGIARA